MAVGEAEGFHGVGEVPFEYEGQGQIRLSSRHWIVGRRPRLLISYLFVTEILRAGGMSQLVGRERKRDRFILVHRAGRRSLLTR